MAQTEISPVVEAYLLEPKREGIAHLGYGAMMADLVKAAEGLLPEETSANSLQHTFVRSYILAMLLDWLCS